MTTPSGSEPGLDLAGSREAPRASPWATAWRVSLYAVAVVFAAWWPTFMLTKVLPSIAHASGSLRLEALVDFYGAPLLGVLCSLALGDLVARRYSGVRAIVYASVMFGGVYLLSLWLSFVQPLSSGRAYGLVWPPHLLFVLAGVILRGRQEFQRSTEYFGMLCWVLAGALSLGFTCWLVWHRSVTGQGASAALIVTCLGVGGVSVVRTVRSIRRLRAGQAEKR